MTEKGKGNQSKENGGKMKRRFLGGVTKKTGHEQDEGGKASAKRRVHVCTTKRTPIISWES